MHLVTMVVVLGGQNGMEAGKIRSTRERIGNKGADKNDNGKGVKRVQDAKKTCGKNGIEWGDTASENGIRRHNKNESKKSQKNPQKGVNNEARKGGGGGAKRGKEKEKKTGGGGGDGGGCTGEAREEKEETMVAKSKIRSWERAKEPRYNVVNSPARYNIARLAFSKQSF